MNDFEKLAVEVGMLQARVVYLERMLEATINKIHDNRPERSKREDCVKEYAGTMGDFPRCACSTQMRCSEHDGNIVREVQ